MGSHENLIIVGIYMLVLVAVGVVFSKLVSNGSDYFRAGGKASWWMVGSSMFMSGISAYTFVGNAAGIYQSGWSPLAIYFANLAGFVLAAFFLAKWYRQMRVVTYAEVIRERFGKVAEQVLAHLLVLNGFMWAGVGLYTLARFLGPIVPDVPVQAIIVCVGVVVVLYCTVGGNWAVMANDFVQGIILVVVTSIVTVLCLSKAGGVVAFWDTFQSSSYSAEMQLINQPQEGESSWLIKYGIGWFIITFVLQFFNQSSLFQGARYFSAKDGREASRASIFAAILMALGLAVFFIPPIYSRLFLESQVMAMDASPQKAVEYAYSVASFELLPKGTFSIMLVAIFAAAISSLDTGLNRNAALIIRDLLPAYRRKLGMNPLKDNSEVKLGKITTVAAGFVVVGIALIYASIEDASIFDVMLTVIAQLISPQVIPLVLFLFIRKVPRWAIFSSLAGGYTPSLIVLLLTNVYGMDFSYQEKGFYVLLGSTFGFIVACPFWAKVSQEERTQARLFYEKMERPVDFDDEVGEANDWFQLIMIGRFAVLLGGVFLLLLIPLHSVESRIVVLIISGVVGGIGGFMWMMGNRLKSKMGK